LKHLFAAAAKLCFKSHGAPSWGASSLYGGEGSIKSRIHCLRRRFDEDDLSGRFQSCAPSASLQSARTEPLSENIATQASLCGGCSHSFDVARASDFSVGSRQIKRLYCKTVWYNLPIIYLEGLHENYLISHWNLGGCTTESCSYSWTSRVRNLVTLVAPENFESYVKQFNVPYHSLVGNTQTRYEAQRDILSACQDCDLMKSDPCGCPCFVWKRGKN
jgi:hypothetical protein